MMPEPNIVIPLVASYNERGLSGFSNTVTNGIDQRKINSMYMPVRNVLSGETTVYLVKRPGTNLVTGGPWGVSSQVSHLTEIRPGTTQFNSGDFWIFSTLGDDIRVSDDTSTTVVVTAASYKPVYVDKTLINGADTLVLEVRNSSFAQRAFFGTTVSTLSEIVSTFTTFSHCGKMEFLDGWAFKLSSDCRIYNSALNNLSTWASGSFITKGITQDVARGLARCGNQIVAFGTNTMEVFVNGGLTPAPLVRVPTLEQRTGLNTVNRIDMRNYYARVGRRIYWIGTHPNGIYSYDGARVEKVSTPAIDKIVTEGIFYSVTFCGFMGYDAVAFSFNTPTDATQRWLMFFPTLNEWFEWNSTVFMPMNSERGSTRFIGIGSNPHRFYSLSGTDNWLDAGTSYTWQHQFNIPVKNNNKKYMPLLEVVGDTARSTTTSTLEVALSKDDWQTTTAVGTINMTSARKRLTRLGPFESCGVVLTHNANLDIRLQYCAMNIK